MAIKLGVVMDFIGSINYKKDTTLAMLWEAEKRGWEIFYFEQKDLYLQEGVAHGKSRNLKVFHDENKWYEFGAEKNIPLADLDVILMRKDPPVNYEYIYVTYILEQAEREGVFVLNKPQSLRDCNEKIFATVFPDCCPPTLVTCSISLLKAFHAKHQDIVCKPLNAMGGSSIFHLAHNDTNASVVFEVLTQLETTFMMAQKFLPEITAGDKRILMINGEPLDFVLARVPGQGEWRGNLAAGAKGIAQPLSDRDRWTCQQIGGKLREKGLYFVGVDVIGDFVTEINVTSPTCVRELDELCNLNICAMLFDFVEQALQKN
jgi:glutathione synthase